MKELKNSGKLEEVLIFILLAAVIGGLIGRYSNSSAQTATKTLTPAQECSITDETGTYSEEDEKDTWDEKTATYIILSDDVVNIDGTNADAAGNTVTIHMGGEYVFSGTWSDGQIVVNSAAAGTVHIILNGTSITSKTGLPIFIEQAEKTVITMASGTENYLEDSKENTLYKGNLDKPDGAIFGKDDLVFNGTGKLKIQANYSDAISCNDNLKMVGGVYELTAVNAGIKGKDSLSIKDGTYSVVSTKDGIKSTKSGDTTRGYIFIDGGEFQLNCGSMGIRANTLLRINDGKLSIDSEGNALHSDGDMQLAGGDISISTESNGVHASANLKITNPHLEVSKAYEAVEALNIQMTGGEVFLTAFDDGINAGGVGSDTKATGNGTGDDADTLTDAAIDIQGGTVFIQSDGDGLDSNGSILITGGTVQIESSTNGGNQAIEANTTCRIDGGTVLATGNSRRAQKPDKDSKQICIVADLLGQQSPNNQITIKDHGGSVVFQRNVEKQFDWIMFSSPDLSSDQAYQVVVGSKEHKVKIKEGINVFEEKSE